MEDALLGGSGGLDILGSNLFRGVGGRHVRAGVPANGWSRFPVLSRLSCKGGAKLLKRLGRYLRARKARKEWEAYVRRQWREAYCHGCGCYMRHDGRCVICDPVTAPADGRVRVWSAFE